MLTVIAQPDSVRRAALRTSSSQAAHSTAVLFSLARRQSWPRVLKLRLATMASTATTSISSTSEKARCERV